MTERIHVVGLCGSLREQSNTRIALKRALDAAESEGASTELIDLRSYDVPVFNADENDAGDAAEIAERIRAADAAILGTPMYHGSYSSPLKTILDYCGFDEFEGKTVGLLAVSGGGFPTPALEHLRSVCRALKAWTLPHQVGIPNSYEQFHDGELANDELADRVETLGRKAVDYAGLTRYPTMTPEPVVAD